MTSQHHPLFQALSQGRLVKAIAGIGNSNKAHVLALAEAANASQSLALDVQATPALVKAVRHVFDGVLFASSLDPQQLAQAIQAGADVAELGNYDELYTRHQYISAESVLSLAEIALSVLPKHGLLCVTVPGHLHADCQVELAQRLEAMGVHMLQTEGAARKLSHQAETMSLAPASKAEQSITNAARLYRAVGLPVICSTGITSANAAKAISHGASGVGVGTAWRAQPSHQWAAYLNELQDVVNASLAAPVTLTPGPRFVGLSLSAPKTALVGSAS
jgi:hypothetical protein